MYVRTLRLTEFPTEYMLSGIRSRADLDIMLIWHPVSYWIPIGIFPMWMVSIRGIDLSASFKIPDLFTDTVHDGDSS